MSKDLNQPDLGPYRTPPLMPPEKVAVTLPVDRYDFAEEQANIDAAIAAGFEIVRGDDLHLLLDLDTLEGASQFLAMRDMVRDKYGLFDEESWASKSGGGRRHVKLRLGTPLGAIQRITLQAILGSDPKRELLGLWKHSRGLDEPSVLFKPPA